MLLECFLFSIIIKANTLLFNKNIDLDLKAIFSSKNRLTSSSDENSIEHILEYKILLKI